MKLWLMGRPGAGKTTIAKAFYKRNINYSLFDNDIFRNGNNDFSVLGRCKNILDVVKYHLTNKTDNIIFTFITPFNFMRDFIKVVIPDIKIVYVYASFEECKIRDPKGMYKKALNGKIKNFTGIDSPFQEPENPDLILNTEKFTVDECVKILENYVEKES